MAKSLSKKRQDMFNELAVNLSFYRNDCEQLFACPFCLTTFDSIKDLSDAHIFPRALGGRIITLACKSCNNEIGSGIESYETERAKFQTAFSGNGEIPWKVQLSPQNGSDYTQALGKITAEMQLVQNEFRTEARFSLFSKGSDPRAIEEIRKHLNKENFTINVQFQARAGWNRAKLTYLQSAFLFLFSQLGYEWALDPCSQVIREQIKQPDEHIIDFRLIEFPESGLGYSHKQTSISWYLIAEPEESRGFLIIFSGLHHWDNPIGVWMPLLGCPYEIPESMNFRVIPLQTLDCHLSNSKNMYLGSKLKYFLQKE